MFRRFEKLLNPTAPPANPEPPSGLLAFFWHFARQAKWLFATLFVIELFVALFDAAIPWFTGRIITLLSSKTPRDEFLALAWPLLIGMLLVVLVARPTVTFAR